MKNNIILSLITLFILIFSCRGNDDEIQYIDQQVYIYMDSLGQDLLNSELQGSYSTISWNDVLADTDNAPVTFSKKVDEDSLFFMSYLAGATRTLTDSTENSKHYRSEIALNITKKNLDATTSTIRDTLVLQYSSTPSLFTLESASYKGVEVFSKTPGEKNIIKIHK